MRASYRLLVASIVTAMLTAGTAQAVHLHGANGCDTGIPADEELGTTWFPRGDLFCPLIADPKEGTFASVLRANVPSVLGRDVGSVGVGDHFGILRWNLPAVGEGVQVGLTANVLAQFDLETSSYDLVNADYTLGLPVTLRRGSWSGRVRVYHQSSHLGDEFVLRSPVQRENFAFEAAEALISADAGPLRLYGGGEYSFSRRPHQLVSRVAHGGVELRQPTPFPPGIRAVAATDVKSSDELNWAVAWSARAGLEFGPSPNSGHSQRRWSLLGEYYHGPSPYGQFFIERVEYYGLGLHLGL